MHTPKYLLSSFIVDLNKIFELPPEKMVLRNWLYGFKCQAALMISECSNFLVSVVRKYNNEYKV